MRRRRSRGGPAPEEVKRMIKDRNNRVREEEDRLQKRVAQLREAREKLNAAVDTIIE